MHYVTRASHKTEASLFPSMNNAKLVKFAGLVGIIGSLFGFITIFESTLLCGAGCGNPIPAPFDGYNAWASDGSFSWRSNALSDLGISKVASIYNSSLIILGILTLIFYIGFMTVYAESRLLYLGGILLILASGSVSLLGVFTEAYATPHLILGFVNFGGGSIGLMLVGLAFIRMKLKPKGYLSLLVGIIGLLICLVPWSSWRVIGVGFAVPEAAVSLMTSAWVVWMSIGLLRNR